tara:strand:+ start:492 stop:1181 length:690 start_codon:yes stop_codon:yes gene_type:complete
MHQSTDKKKSYLFLFLILFFLSSINSQIFIKKKELFYNLNSIEVIGLDEQTNAEIEKKLNFIKNTSIFFIDKEIIKDQINKYNFIEKYNIFKIYPSKIIFELKQADFLAQTIKNNKVYIIGSNNNFIEIERFDNYENLPIVYGKFTAKEFTYFVKILKQSELNYNNINEIFFYPSGRIDIKNKDNLLIRFPIQNLKEAIIIVNKIIKNKNFKNNLIDLRVPNQLILSNE